MTKTSVLYKKRQKIAISAGSLAKKKADTDMDDLDQRLIAELRVNARASIPTLASLLGVARGTVQSRMERLLASEPDLKVVERYQQVVIHLGCRDTRESNDLDRYRSKRA